MTNFGSFYLDREKDIIVELLMDGGELRYVLRTPNHRTGNLITNLARLCGLPLSFDEQGLKVIRGTVPCYVDGYNRRLYIFRLGNTKVANIYPDGTIELKASIPSISKTLMSQTKEYRLDENRSIVKTYIRSDCKFRTDLHTHMNGILEPDILIALGIHHQIRYPLYYIKKLGLRLSPAQEALLAARREKAAAAFADSGLTGKYLDRRIDDNTFLNFADLILRNLPDAAYNIPRIRCSLTIPKDGQAVFANLEQVYLYRYVFTKGLPAEDPIEPEGEDAVPDADIVRVLAQLRQDRENPAYRGNTLFQDKLLWIARSYCRWGIDYAEISDTTLVKSDAAVEMLRQVHEVMPAVTAETGVLLRFLAGIRRIPLTIVRDSIAPNDYLRENLRVLRVVAQDPYVAGSDILGEEINDIQELRPVLREIVRIAGETPGFVIRIHAGENDNLRDNVANAILCVSESLAPGQEMPRLRIGHGLYTCNLASPKGERLLREIRDKRVVLEFQITSNVRLNNLSDLEHHPLKAYLAAGVQCVQGTDGPALYGTDSIDEELALEKLLHLSHEQLLQIRGIEERIFEDSMDVFRQKEEAFRAHCGGRSAEETLRGDLSRAADPASVYWLSSGRTEAALALRGQIVPLPAGLFPVLVAGGSFNSDNRRTQVRPEGLRILDELLEKGDPQKLYFFIGHKLTGYEGYLLEQNRGRFRIICLVPSMLSRVERERLQKSGVEVHLAVEPTGMGLYKSFAYEIFKRVPSALLAFDGNSAALNLIQEARNGREKCRIFINGRCRSLRAKAEMLQGYVKVFRPEEDVAGEVLTRYGLYKENGGGNA